MIKLLFTFFCFSLIFNSCDTSKNNQIAFYYWKTNPELLDKSEYNYIQQTGTKKLYIKMFEVEMNGSLEAVPISKSNLNFQHSSIQNDSLNFLHQCEIIPTIFILNEVFEILDTNRLNELAENIIFLIQKRFNEKLKLKNDYTEIQIDCDWTVSTRENYFTFLRILKQKSQKHISVTLRLYPFKYSKKMGIPPVDKVTLMCYNLINPLINNSKNSILDNKELELYLKNASTYPIQMDFALPIYSWAIFYRNKQFNCILKNDIEKCISNSIQLKPLWYQLKNDLEIGNQAYRKGDIFKVEKINSKKLLQATILIKNIDFHNNVTLTFFDLNSANFNTIQPNEIKDIFTVFNN